MQAKRNPLGNYNLTNNNKPNCLMQPLISISKASTPVRTRIIGGSQMNSTPVNLHKIVGQTHKSPNNKENHVYNQIKTESSKNAETDTRINLSPILALNRKLNEGPSQQQKKSLTPEGPKTIQDYEDYPQGPTDKNYQTLNGSKGQQNGFSSTTNFSNLRSSNSFKNLIENRCKTPTKLENIGTPTGMFAKRDSAPLLKQSLSSNQLFRNFGRQSKTKLMESRSFDKFKPFNSGSDLNETKCMNNDGRKAKYHVINHDNYGEELYYCSKCTIPLVQQGFIVEELNKQNQDDYGMEDSTRRTAEFKNRLEGKKNGLAFVLKEINRNEQQELSHLNCYYEDLIGFLQQQRNADNEKIRNHYNNKKKEPQRHFQDVEQTLQTMSRFTKQDQVDRLLQINEQQYVTEHQFNVPYEQMLSDFTKQFQGYFKPHLDNNELPLQSARQQQQADSISSRNHAMRFSFEKLLTDIGSKKSKMQSIMNPLQQEQEENENEVYIPRKQEHTAFRDLFPDGEEMELHNNDLHSPTFKNF